MKYNLKEISVVIPTYNRSDDLIETISSFGEQLSQIGELLIIDQSKNDLTKKALRKFKSKNIKYYHREKPSLTAARNFGVKNVSKKSKIVIFLDDDVSLGKDYFLNILKVFSANPLAVGVSGYYFPKSKKINRFEGVVRKLFRLEHWSVNEARVLSVYGAGYPYKLTMVIKSDWISGFNMAFKKEVFENFLFDERMSRYALAEDFEFTTRISKKFPDGFYITPYAHLVHRASTAERMPTQKIAYMNHTNHFYIQAKVFNEFYGIISWIVALIGMSLFQIFSFIINPRLARRLKCSFHFKALAYCFRRLHLIRKGILDLPEGV